MPFKSRVAPAVMEVDPVVDPKAAAFPSLRVPALTVVAPENVFAPDKVHTPAPDLVRVPVDVPITPATVPAPVPVRVRAKAPVIPPDWERLMFPGLVMMLAAADKVIGPAKVAAVDDLLLNAPPELMPVPAIVKGSAAE